MRRRALGGPHLNGYDSDILGVSSPKTGSLSYQMTSHDTI
jgi:hypothetical protein